MSAKDMSAKELCVIFNPTAGKHRAKRRLDALKARWGDHALFQPTAHPGHAVTLAKEAARDGFRIVAAAGGDGTAHEVANGLLEAGRDDVRFGLVPVGSANDYAYSVAHDAGPAESGIRRVDVGRVRGPGGKTKFFICCLGLGFNGAVTLEARRIPWLQGMLLYGYAAWRAVWRHYACPMMRVAIDGGAVWETPTLLLSTLVGKREGGFVLAPDARLDDGRLDYVHVGRLSRAQVLCLLPRLALFGPPRSHPRIRQGVCTSMRLESTAPLNVHLDGEFFCTADENVRELEIDVLPRALQVQLLA
jgi:diacylglycerol kinase family enzyme